MVDNVTDYIFNNHQINLTATTTVGSKHQCKYNFDEFGVKIKLYAANNHPSRSKVWVADCVGQLQLPTSHSSMEAHNQSQTKRHIQTIIYFS